MRYAISTILLAGVALSFFPLSSDACGAKFVPIGRGSDYVGIHGTDRPASILIYESRDSKAAAAVLSSSFRNQLRKAGHKVSMCEDIGECEVAVMAGHIDIVMADASDLAKIEEAVALSAMRPQILPLLYKAPKAEIALVESHYDTVFNAPSKPSQLLTAIDDLMTARKN